VIRAFALSASLGVVIAFSCVVTLLPILLAAAPMGARPGRMRRVGRLGYGRRALTWTAFAAVTAAGALGAARIDIGSRWLEELPDHEPIARDLMWYQEHFNGFLSVDVKLRGNLDSIEAFRAVRRLEDAVLEEPGVTGAESYVDWVREWIGNPDGELGSAQIVAGLATLKLSSAALSFPEHAVTRDFRLGRIRFQIADIGTGPVLDLIESIEDETEDFPSGLTAEVAGFDRVRLETSYGIVLTMLKSLIVSTVSIGIFLMIVYRSVGIGLLATIPNAFPILVALGVTGFAGIPLRIGIVMIYSLGVGLSVDNTIHLFSRFRDESRRHPERGVAGNLRRSLATTGHALIASSLVLVVGALCYLPSSFQSMSDVGILLSTMVVAALLAQIFLTPHLIEGCARWLRIAPPDAPGSTSPVPPPTTTGPGDGPSDPGSGATGPRDTGPASPRE